VIVEQSALDYLTLSEKLDPAGRPTLPRFVNRIGTRVRKSKRIGYEGCMYDFLPLSDDHDGGAFFYGERDWQGAQWGLLIASGENAHWVVQHIWQTDLMYWAGVRCTRLDIQVTIPWPLQPFFLRHLVLTQDVSATVIHGVSGDNDWSETLYLGSRASPCLVRAYRKRIDDSWHDWLRVEVEYKRQASERLFYTLLVERRVGNWFLPVQQRCLSLYEMVEDYLDTYPARPKTQRIVGKTMRWLSTTVSNCVCRLLEDDDCHEEMVELVAQWYNYSRSCQSRRTMVE